MNDKLVYNPEHYNHSGRKECWEEMREIFGDSAVVIFDVLNAYKYMYRAGSKDGNPKEQDLAKIDNYLSHAKKIIKESKIDIYDESYKVIKGYYDRMAQGFNPYQE